MAEGTRFHPVLAEPGVDDDAGHAPGAVHRQDLLRPRRPPRPPGARPGLAVGARRAALPVPRRPDPRADRSATRTCARSLWVQEEPRNMGARAHMFPRLMQIMPDEHPLRLHRAARAREPGRGLPGGAHRRTEPHRHDRDRPARADLAVPAQDARGALMRRAVATLLGDPAPAPAQAPRRLAQSRFATASLSDASQVTARRGRGRSLCGASGDPVGGLRSRTAAADRSLAL